MIYMTALLYAAIPVCSFISGLIMLSADNQYGWICLVVGLLTAECIDEAKNMIKKHEELKLKASVDGDVKQTINTPEGPENITLREHDTK